MKSFWKLLAIFVLATMVLTACATPAATEEPATEEPAAPTQTFKAGQELTDAYAGKYSGTVVTMQGPFTDADAVKFDNSIKAFEDAINLVRKGGTVMMFGVPSKGAQIPLDMSVVYSKEVTLVTSYAASDNDTKEALRLIADGKVDVKKLITHKYPISETQKAFDHAHKGSDSMKIIITK